MLKQNRKKGVIIALIGIASIFATMSFSTTRRQLPQPKHNLKVLPQDISHDSLIGIMHGFEKALNVKCGFCHARSEMDSTKLDFASDANHKKDFAREMMKMTAAINANYFNWHQSNRPYTISRVTCMTCHHGNEKPIR